MPSSFVPSWKKTVDSPTGAVSVVKKGTKRAERLELDANSFRFLVILAVYIPSIIFLLEDTEN